MLKKLKNVYKLLIPTTTWIVIAVVLLDCVATYFSIAYLYTNITDRELVLPEFIVGYSAIKNYYKPGDFMIPRLIIMLFVVYFLGFSIFFNLYNKWKSKIGISHIILCIWSLFIAYEWYFGKLEKIEVVLFFAFLIICLICYIVVGKIKKEKQEDVEYFIAMCAKTFIILFFALRLMAQIYIMLTSKTNLEISILTQCILVIILCILSIVLGIVANKKFLYIPQAVLCFFPISLWSFHLLYRGEIQSRSYTKLNIFIIAICIFLVIILTYSYKKGKEISSSTFMIIGAMQLHCDYFIDAFKPINLFHEGEMIVPMQQLLEYGKVPFIDFYPVHGLCDYYFQAWNYILFDATYESYNYAYLFGGLILCSIIAFIFYKVFQSNTVGLLITVLFTVVGEWYYYFRFFFIIPVVLILFSRKAYKSVYKTVLLYTYSCIVMILWYSTVGVALAVALLPIIIYRIFCAKGRKQLKLLKYKKVRQKVIKACGPLLAALTTFLCFLSGIIEYLFENMSISAFYPGGELTAIYSNYISANPFYISDPVESQCVQMFSFLFPIILLGIIAFINKKSRYLMELWYAMIVFAFLIVSYTFGSVASGERAIIIAICYFVIVASVSFFENRKKLLKNHYMIVIGLCCLFMGIGLNGQNKITDQGKYFTMERILNEFEKFDGKTIGMPNLGTGYAQEEYVKNLSNYAYIINNVCFKNRDTFLDLTDQGALMMLSGKRLSTPYSNLYNATSEKAQDKMLESIKEEKPRLVLVSPFWENDGGSVSLKNKKIYQYLCNNYIPYSYNDACFMLDKEQGQVEWAEDGMKDFWQAMHVVNLEKLPMAWAKIDSKEANLQKVELPTEIVECHNLEYNEETIRINGEDPYFVLKVCDLKKMSDAEYIRFKIKMMENNVRDNNELLMNIYFSPNGRMFDENNKFSFCAWNNEMLVPLYSTPDWSELNWEYLRVDFEFADIKPYEINMGYCFEKQVN